MKKLLLALAVLTGGFVPGMAQNYNQIDKSISEICEERYDISHGDREAVFDALFKYDLECLQYFANEKGINIAKVTKDDIVDPLYFTIYSENKRTLDILSFLIQQNLSLTEDKPYIGSWGRNTNIISYLTDTVASGLYYFKDTNALSMRKLKLLLNEGGENIWAAIHDDTIFRVIYSDIQNDNISLVQFLIDQNMPLSEYDRYIQATENNMAESLNQKSLWAEDSSKVSYYQNCYEKGGEILELLKQTKETIRQDKVKPVIQDLDKKLNEINYDTNEYQEL